MTAEKTKLTRQAMCDRLAMEFQDGWIVNLGVGMPTLCSNYVDNSRSHSSTTRRTGSSVTARWRARDLRTATW